VRSGVSGAHLDAIYFDDAAAFRAWLERHHETARELWVGYYRKSTGRPTLTWQDSVAEALCFGWIDGIRRKVDDERYANRFTPRKAGSTWSAVNVATMERLLAEGRVRPAGLRAWEARTAARTGIYSYEQRALATLADAEERTFRKRRTAWKYWESCPPGYRKQMIWRIVSARRPETRAKRLEQLMASCEAGKRMI
jgi:uncharacterized protein YdeI (YjbR/CyaY-like superfamily)